ncbi:MAG: hypothetical protein ACI9MR_005045 [Myxococcota bacterium]|jgi:hypothetical protein
MLAPLCIALVGFVPACDDYDSPSAVTPLEAYDLPDDIPVATASDLPDERPANCAVAPTPGPAPLRRLTRTEFNNTVQDLTGTTTRPGDAFPPEEEVLGFDNNASGRSVSQIHIERYMGAAEMLVAEMLSEQRVVLIPCDPTAIDPLICAERVIERFGKLAFRRFLTDAERLDYRNWFEDLHEAKGLPFDEAIGMVLEAVLQSPHFLYRLELGVENDLDGDGAIELTGFEIATRMSYFLWHSMPDDYLLGAAEIGLLDTAEGIRNEAFRLLRDDRAHDTVLHFHRQWLQLDELEGTFKDDDVFPGFDAVKDLLGQETETFILKTIFEGPGDLRTLLTSPGTYTNATLDAFYAGSRDNAGATDNKAPAFEAEKGLRYVEQDATKRAGIFTHGSIMATQAKPNQTSPVLRGKWVREQMLCHPLEPPPPFVDVTPPPLDPNLSTRDRFKEHSDNPACSGCHELMEPLGWTFEHYDAVGRWRDTENGGQPIDSSGEILFTQDANGPLTDAVDMAYKLAESKQVHECYVYQWFRYAHGRDTAPTGADACTLWDLRDAFKSSNADVQTLLLAITQTDSFRYRPVVSATNTPYVDPDPLETDDGN